MNATKLADTCLTNVRHQANITQWMIAVRHAIALETDPAKRVFLAKMLVEFNNRLPERKV